MKGYVELFSHNRQRYVRRNTDAAFYKKKNTLPMVVKDAKRNVLPLSPKYEIPSSAEVVAETLHLPCCQLTLFITD